MLLGLKLQLRFEGNPLQLRFIAFRKAGLEYAKTDMFADCPAFTVMPKLSALKVKSPALIGNANGCDGPPPGSPLKTESWRVPVVVRSDGGRSKYRSVGLNTYVRAGTPFTSTTDV